MKYANEDMIRKLQEYPSLMRAKQQLEFELSLLSAADKDNEREKFLVSQRRQSELLSLLDPVTVELRRMEAYIDLIPEKDGAVLKAMFIGGMTYKEITSALHIDAKTIVKRKNSGLTELAAMYSRLPEETTQASGENPVKVQ